MNTAATRHDTDWIGQVVDGKFTLIQWLGNSGHGDVFLTELPGDSPQKAAIKLFPSNAPSAESQMAGWSAAKRLSHPHLMRLIHVGQCQIRGTKLFYAVMEFAEENLSQILPERPLTPTETREMLEPLIGALAYVHQEGMVHGHLKPSNIMVVKDQLKLSCDGVQAAGSRVKPPPILTVYDAPERTKQGLTPAADIWSLGVTLVETLNQAPPAWDKSKNRDPLVPSSVPSPFADIARDCLHTDPALRCTLKDIQARLRPASSVAAASKVKPMPKMMPAPVAKADSTRLRIAAILAAALILIVGIVFLATRSRPSGSSPAETQQASPTAKTSGAAPPLPKSSAAVGTFKGAVVSRVLPDVSPSASNTIHGTVKVRVKAAVDSNGSVSDASLESTGPSRYFSNLALQAAQQWKFKPPQVNGKPVASTWILQFEFRQTGPSVTPSESSPSL